jgi:SAM-dependent MidA family methyltransferase
MTAVLEDHLLRRIRGNQGWLPFDDFMAEALYAPGLGYYNSGRQTFGLDPRDGSDFITAPEMSPFFGRCLARQLDQALKASETDTIWEFGAGSGALAAELLAELDQLDGARPQYKIIELSGSLRARQQARLAAFGDRVRWIDALPDALDGVVIGNEVLDAMPVKLLHFDGARWFERGVAAGLGQAGEALFRWSDRPSELRPPFDHGRWVAGTVTEIHPQSRAWIQTIATTLRRGALFLVDYGFSDAEYYLPQRLGGTLMCHHRHQSDANPLVQVGEKDITAHVNFTAIALAGQDAGLEVLGYTSQARFLLNCGLTKLLESGTLRERSMAQKLITEHEMGELFKVIGFATAEHIFDAIGFCEGDRSHRL